MGVTESDKGEKLTLIAAGKEDGLQNGNFFGSRISMGFLTKEMCSGYLRSAYSEKGARARALPASASRNIKERQYEQLASLFVKILIWWRSRRL
jgi:hypothetical protein